MADLIVLRYEVKDGEFQYVGEASSSVKKTLRMLDVPPDALRRISIALYEGEVNMVIHAHGGNITVEISPEEVKMVLDDVGPGIPDIEQALQPGWSTAPDEIRNLGFGAGMGLPNMKANTDSMEIDSRIGEGTRITMTVKL